MKEDNSNILFSQIIELQDIKNILQISSASIMPVDLLELCKQTSILHKERGESHKASYYNWIDYS